MASGGEQGHGGGFGSRLRRIRPPDPGEWPLLSYLVSLAAGSAVGSGLCFAALGTDLVPQMWQHWVFFSGVGLGISAAFFAMLAAIYQGVEILRILWRSTEKYWGRVARFLHGSSGEPSGAAAEKEKTDLALRRPREQGIMLAFFTNLVTFRSGGGRFSLWRFSAFTVPALVVPAGIVLAILRTPFLADQCDPPTELIVATTPEGQIPVQQAGDAFAEERAEREDDSCRPVHVQVYAPGEPQRISRALAGEEGWDPGLGPLPHVWIPESRAEADTARRAAAREGSPFTLEPGGPTRMTPLVVALPRQTAADLFGTGEGGPLETGDPLEELSGPVERGELHLVRADPAVSYAAVLHTALRYMRLGAVSWSGQVRDPEEAARFESSLWPGVAARSESDLLCRTAEQPDGGVPVAALTTEAALYRMRSGEPFGTACPEAVAEDLVGVYSEAWPVLEHPVVRVDSGAEEGSAEEAAAAFQSHLETMYEEEPPFAAPDPEAGPAAGIYAGYRNSEGRGEEAARAEDAPPEAPSVDVARDWRPLVAAALELHRQPLEPAVVLIALDTSTSMRMPGRKFDTALAEAESLVAASGEEDELGLWTFPATTDRSDTGHVPYVSPGPGTQREITERLGEVRAIFESTPLTDVIADGVAYLDAEHSGPADSMLVVVTEGVGEPEGAALETEELAGHLADARTRVRILAVGDETERWGHPDPCRVDRLPELVELDGVDCEPADPDRPGGAGHRLLLEARGP